MVEFRDVVKKYTDPGEALGRDPDTGDVTGLEPGTDVDPVAVVTDPAAQAALSATFGTPVATTIPYRIPVGDADGTLTLLANRVITCGNIRLTTPLVLKAVHLEVHTAGDSTSEVAVGAAKMGNDGVLTGQPIVQLGSVSTAASGVVSITDLDVPMGVGVWGFYALAINETATRPTMRVGHPLDTSGHSGFSTLASMLRYNAFVTAANHTSMPDTVPSMVTGAQQGGPLIAMEFDAAPSG